MARAKGMLNLSGNIEVLAGAPFDARDIVPTKADLTVASNFPYPYVGMETYVTAENKKYRYMGGDITDLSNWAEIGSGGGGQTYNDFTGATSSTAGAHGLVPAPSAGDEGKVLFGNGAWGALPSVDLSVLSNEAFQFSPIEKPVGTWTDSNNVTKLLYAKTVYNTTPSAVQSDKQFYIDSNIDIKQTSVLWFSVYSTMKFTGMHGGLVNWTVRDNGQSLYVWTRESEYANKDAYITLFYTKTTDSPLPSDVKFAGVTSAGEVILEKTVTGLNLFLVWDQQYVAAADMPYDTSSIGKLISLSGVGHSGENTPMSFALTGYVTGNNIKLICPAGAYVEEVTVRYTKPTT